MHWGPFGATHSLLQMQIAVVAVGPPSGSLSESWDFDSKDDIYHGVGVEAVEPKAPTVNLAVLGSSSKISDSFTVPLSTVMRISDDDQISSGTRLLLLYKQVDAGSSGQITVWDAFKTSASSLSSGADHLQIVRLALAQALGHASVMEGSRLLDLLMLDIPRLVEVSKKETVVEEAMISAAKTAPSFLSYGIYLNLSDYEFPGIYESIVRAYLSLTKDPEAWQTSGPESGNFGEIAGDSPFPAFSQMIQARNYLLPSPDLWESVILNGTNPTAVRAVLHQFCNFSLIGSKENETKMFKFLDSPDYLTRLYAADHFASIYTNVNSALEVIYVKVLRAYPRGYEYPPANVDTRSIALRDLAAVIDPMKARLPALIASGEVPKRIQSEIDMYHYFN